MRPKDSRDYAALEQSDNAPEIAPDDTATSAASCGCGAHGDAASEGRKAVAVDSAVKERNIKRLRRKFRAVDPAFAAIETLYGAGYSFGEG